MAKLVMRRELALCRERSGLSKPAEANDSIATNTISNQDHVSEQKPEDAQKPNDPALEDIIMQDSEPSETQEAAKDASQGALTAQEPSDIEKPVSAPTDVPIDPGALNVAPETDQRPSEAALKVDTQSQPKDDKADGEQPADEDKPPDTGTFSNVNDLESLFGGPLSAGPGDAPDFSIDPNTNDDFDFDAFASSLDNNTADNDNISTLLPGLEDYANTQSSGAGEQDFDAIFSGALPANMEGDEQRGIPHRDSTFDDLGDLLDFNVGEFTGGTGEGGEDENNEFDFSMQ